MLANYEIYSVITGVVVGRTVLDVYGDPNEFTICYEAVDHAGYGDSCDRMGALYKARFAGYADSTVEVPIEAMEAIARLLNGDLSVPNCRTLRRTLLASGCIEKQGHTYQVVQFN